MALCEAVTSRHCAGSGREVELYDDLTALGVAFWTEEDLRDRGFFKTPDARLRVCWLGFRRCTWLIPAVSNSCIAAETGHTMIMRFLTSYCTTLCCSCPLISGQLGHLSCSRSMPLQTLSPWPPLVSGRELLCSVCRYQF